jgi:hypothetical protein
MGQGISEVLTFAVGVAISPVPIIAVILMLFSAKARVNGLVFLAGWALALAVVSGAVYFLSDAVSRCCTWAVCRGPESASTSGRKTSPSPQIRTHTC